MAAYQIEDASNILVLFGKKSSGRGPCKQYRIKFLHQLWSIAVNQLDRGFFHASAAAPEMIK